MIERPVYRRQKRFFARAYETGEHGWPVKGPTREVAALLRRVARRGDRALDLGCGEGRHAIFLAKLGCRVDAVDLEPRALRLAAAEARRAGVRIRFRAANALKLPFSDATFDVVVDYGCFHHVVKPDWKRFVREVRRVLRPGGHLSLSVFSTKYKHHAGERRTRPWIYHRDHYDRFFTRAEIPRIFGPAFEVVAIREEHRGLNGFWHTLLRKPTGPA